MEAVDIEKLIELDSEARILFCEKITKIWGIGDGGSNALSALRLRSDNPLSRQHCPVHQGLHEFVGHLSEEHQEYLNNNDS
jgi:hypothetical protein